MKSTVKEISALDEPERQQAAQHGRPRRAKRARAATPASSSPRFCAALRAASTGRRPSTRKRSRRGLEAGAKTAYKGRYEAEGGHHPDRHPRDRGGFRPLCGQASGRRPKLLDKVIPQRRGILEKTPDMLPALKQAGVVDSGGQGLLTVLKAGAQPLTAKKIEDTSANVGSAATFEFEDDHDSMEEVKFKYCTEFIIQYMNPGRDRGRRQQIPHQPDPHRRLRGGRRRFLAGEGARAHQRPRQGDSICLRIGRAGELKIDNMAEERRERLQKAEAAQKAAEEKKRQEEAGRPSSRSG